MTKFVLDCSVTISWLFEDEASKTTDNILDKLKENGAYVPNLWHLEVANVLIQASKRGRIETKTIPERLNVLSMLPIKTDIETHHKAFTTIIYLAEEQKLTSYDAAYLELALRRNFPIATKDTALRKAAENLKIPVLC